MLGFGNNNGGRAPDLAGAEITGELERVTLWHHVSATPGLLFMLKGHSQAFRATRIDDLDTLSQPGDMVKFRVLPSAPGEGPFVVRDTFMNMTLAARADHSAPNDELSRGAKH